GLSTGRFDRIHYGQNKSQEAHPDQAQDAESEQQNARDTDQNVKKQAQLQVDHRLAMDIHAFYGVAGDCPENQRYNESAEADDIGQELRKVGHRQEGVVLSSDALIDKFHFSIDLMFLYIRSIKPKNVTTIAEFVFLWYVIFRYHCGPCDSVGNRCHCRDQ